jgi:hypothetical protein
VKDMKDCVYYFFRGDKDFGWGLFDVKEKRGKEDWVLDVNVLLK